MGELLKLERPAFKERTPLFWLIYGSAGGMVFVTTFLLADGVLQQLHPGLAIICAVLLASLVATWTISLVTYGYPYGHAVRFDIPSVESAPTASPLLARVDSLLNDRDWGMGSAHPRTRRAQKWLKAALEDASLSDAERAIITKSLATLQVPSGSRGGDARKG